MIKYTSPHQIYHYGIDGIAMTEFSNCYPLVNGSTAEFESTSGGLYLGVSIPCKYVITIMMENILQLLRGLL